MLEGGINGFTHLYFLPCLFFNKKNVNQEIFNFSMNNVFLGENLRKFVEIISELMNLGW